MNPVVSLTEDIFSRYGPSRVFTTATSVLDSDRSVVLSPVTSLDFEPIEGTLVLAAHGRANALTLFNANVGITLQRFHRVASEGGVAIARFTRRIAESSCLIAPKVSTSDALSYAIRTYSLMQNTTIRTFPGHGQQVCSMAQSPIDDGFATSDTGGEVRIWDARQSMACVGRMRIPMNPTDDSGRMENDTFICYHPDGGSFACLHGPTGTIRVFNLLNLNKGPFRILQVPSEVKFPRPSVVGTEPEKVNYVDIRYSPNGCMFLVTTDQNFLYTIDATTGRLIFQADCQSSKQNIAVPSFSADGNYVAIGGVAGPLVYRCSDGQLLTALEVGNVCNASRICSFSPKTELLITSGDDATIFWTERDR